MKYYVHTACMNVCIYKFMYVCTGFLSGGRRAEQHSSGHIKGLLLRLVCVVCMYSTVLYVYVCMYVCMYECMYGIINTCIYFLQQQQTDSRTIAEIYLSHTYIVYTQRLGEYYFSKFVYQTLNTIIATYIMMVRRKATGSNTFARFLKIIFSTFLNEF